jgi:hypothetical protein
VKNDARDRDLQMQVDDLRRALEDWRRSHANAQPMEERLAQITLQCARMVESWQQMERQRSKAIAGIGDGRVEWDPADARLQEAIGERIRSLERAIEREWDVLPRNRDESSRLLTEQTASLAESCVAAAHLTLRGFAGVESRLAALEQDVQVRMTQLSQDLQAVVAELRSGRQQALPATTAAFPLESVMRIHQEMREAEAPAAGAPEVLKPVAAAALPAEIAEPTAALVARVDSLERAVETATEAVSESRGGWRPIYAVAGVVVLLVGFTVFGVWMQRRVDARLSEAALRVSEAERQRDASVAATREEAARQVEDARQSAAQAQIVGNVLAAPDLIRYWLGGVNTNSRAYAQVILSRSRGLVFSASRLEPAGAGKTYQLWILTRSGPVSAGLITPDSAGRATFATDVPLTLPGRLAGAMVTVEPDGGSAQPSTETALTRTTEQQ